MVQMKTSHNNDYISEILKKYQFWFKFKTMINVLEKVKFQGKVSRSIMVPMQRPCYNECKCENAVSILNQKLSQRLILSKVG